MLLGTVEISPFLNVGGLELGGGSVNNVLETVGVSEELGVTDLTVGFSVLGGNALDLLDAQLVAEEDKDLSELLLGHLEVLVAIPVLEEGLGIESVLADDFGETVKNGLDLRSFISGGGGASVESLGSGVVEWLVNVLFESLLGEDLIDGVTEVSPVDVLASFGGLERGAEHLEFGV